MKIRRKPLKFILLTGVALTLGACTDGFDLDLRGNFGNAFDSSSAVAQRTAQRPEPDNRGVISYPNYQVAVANRGDTIADVAARVGLQADELARYNGISRSTVLRRGEIIALPRRIAEPSPATGAISTGPIKPAGAVDITSIAGDAIKRADSPKPEAQPAKPAKPAKPAQKPPHKAQTGEEPVRHKVARGETAYTIARLYNISPKALAEWNGLGADLQVREGQYLLIPVVVEDAAPQKVTAPGTGSLTPVPPSASTPLPAQDATPLAKAEIPPSPDLGADKTIDSAKFVMPVPGKIIRDYTKGKSDGIDIAATPGTPVKAADDGTIAAITQDTDQVTIVVIRHTGNTLTIYANVENVTLKKGDKVKRGQSFAKTRSSDPTFLHFEVRQGFDSVDPMPYLN